MCILPMFPVCCRRAARATGGVRCRGEAGAELLADQREPHQGVLLAQLPLLHREQAHPGLLQSFHSQAADEHQNGRHAGLGEGPHADVAHPRVPAHLASRYGA